MKDFIVDNLIALILLLISFFTLLCKYIVNRRKYFRKPRILRYSIGIEELNLITVNFKVYNPNIDKLVYVTNVIVLFENVEYQFFIWDNEEKFIKPGETKYLKAHRDFFGINARTGEETGISTPDIIVEKSKLIVEFENEFTSQISGSSIPEIGEGRYF